MKLLRLLLLVVEADHRANLILTGIIQRLYTQDQFILFTTKSLNVTGGSQESLRLFGVRDLEADGIESDIVGEGVLISHFVNDGSMKDLMLAVEHRDAQNKLSSASGIVKTAKFLQVSPNLNKGDSDPRQILTAACLSCCFDSRFALCEIIECQWNGVRTVNESP